MTAAEFARLIPGARRHPSGEWSGLCPSHDDGKASLTFRDGDACLLVTCHAGCALESVTAALSLTLAQLRNPEATPVVVTAPAPPPRSIVATYDYTDERGALLYQAVRGDPKAFLCRRPDGAGGWIWNLAGVRVVPYRLAELPEARRVFIVEGEKDADTLAALGLTATTNHGGALKWRAAHTAALVAASVPEVVVLRDNDRPGEAHAAAVAAACLAAGLRVRRVNLPGPLTDKHGTDVSDWLAAGHDTAELEALADAAPILEPGAGVPVPPVTVVSPVAPAAPRRLPAGFIAEYVEVAGRRTDAPLEAHALTAVGVLSALAGSRVRLPLAYRSDGVRLALWTMNVVDSTGGRKTTTLEFGTDVVRQVLGDDAILPWKGSPEAFIQALALRDGHASVFARDEYSGLLAGMKRGGYVAGLAQDFIRAYDGLPITMGRTAMNRKTGERVDDTDRVRDPYLVKLCAATRTAFVETATIDDVLDGLLARFVFASGTAEEQRPRAMTREIEEAWAAVGRLAQAFHDRATELLRIEVPEAVLDRSWELEKRFKAAALESPRPDAARPAMKRLAETALKVGALLAIDRGRNSLDPDDFDDAATLVECWQATTLALIADIGRTRFQARCDAVLGTIRCCPAGIMLSALYRAHRDLDKREFEGLLDALEMQRLIHRIETPTGKPGRVPAVYLPGSERDDS
jgi:hypothetical protein